MKKYVGFIALVLILLSGFLLRFNNINWDSDSHLHPDERFLTMVTDSMQVPTTFGEYLDPSISKFNPSNIGHTFFVYGTFPLFIVKFVSLWMEQSTYGGITPIGRATSGVFDMAVILFVYLIILELQRKFKFHPFIKYLGAFSYVVMVHPIQLSHFYATDTFLNTFMIGSFYFALKFALQKDNLSVQSYTTSIKLLWLVLSAIFVGFGIASKVNAFFIIPLNGVIIALGFIKEFPNPKFNLAKIIAIAGKLIPYVLALAPLYLIFAYLSTRLSDPYLFQTGNLLDFTLNKNYLQGIESLTHLNKKEAWFPPGVQWINNPPVIYALRDIVIWGTGVVVFATSIVGLVTLFSKVKKQPGFAFGVFVCFVWFLGCFVYQGVQFTKTMRYFIYLYPFIAIAAGFGFLTICKGISKLPKVPGMILLVIFAISYVTYAAAFQSIYFRPHSRIEASRWIFFNLPSGTQFANEHWDDGLPIPLPENPGKSYAPGLELPVFGDDKDPTKWPKIDAALAQADYYILSSNRAWGSVVTVPERFPKQTQFYKDLFAGKTQYKLEKKFTSFPGFDLPWGGRLELDDSFSDEAFSVYDHPIVMIYKNTNPQKPEATMSAKPEEKK